MTDYSHEARIVYGHLMGSPPPAKAMELYRRYRNTTEWNPDAKERKAWQLALRYPFLMGCFDGYLALAKPQSAYRQPIYAMLAIAESLPDKADQFLAKKYGPGDCLRVARAFFAATAKAALGALAWTLL